MTQQFILIGSVEFTGDRNLLLERRVEAYDRPFYSTYDMSLQATSH